MVNDNSISCWIIVAEHLLENHAMLQTLLFSSLIIFPIGLQEKDTNYLNEGAPL